MMRIWNLIERALIGILGAFALTIGTYQVVGRYVDQRLAFAYGEEIVVYLTVWAVFLAGSQLVRTDGHVRPDIVLRLLPSQMQRWVETFNCCVAIVFCLGLTYCGFQITQGSWELDERSITGLEFPMWLYYASVMVGGALMAVRYVIRLYRYAFRFDPATMVIAVQDH
jgi:TRAP-type C4-dicarboxylate transport system permease small subunit